MFKKKVLDKKLADIKAYRKQFEDEDDEIRSFKNEKSTSPLTPKLPLNLNFDAYGSNRKFDDCIEGGSPLMMPIRHQNSDVGPIMKLAKLN